MVGKSDEGPMMQGRTSYEGQAPEGLRSWKPQGTKTARGRTCTRRDDCGLEG